MRLENYEIPYSPLVTSCGTNYHRFSKKYIVEKQMLFLYICFLIRGMRWKTNFVGPLGKDGVNPNGRHEIIPGWQYDNSYHCITLVVPPIVNPHNKLHLNQCRRLASTRRPEADWFANGPTALSSCWPGCPTS